MKFHANEHEVLKLFLEYEAVRKNIETLLTESDDDTGFCSICDKVVSMPYVPSDQVWVNLRGQFKCSSCGFQNRFRFMLKAIFATLGQPVPGHGIIFERITPFFRFLEERCDDLQGCEYFGPEHESGSMVKSERTVRAIGDQVIQHQDMQKLSFEDNHFDYLIQADVLEHIPDPDAALAECCRVLKPGGVMLLACPIYGIEETNPIAKLNDAGEIEWFNKPLFHGNPMSADGAPVFNNFGFELFERVRRAGFSKVEIGFDHDPLERFTSDNSPNPKTLMWPILVRAYA